MSIALIVKAKLVLLIFFIKFTIACISLYNVGFVSRPFDVFDDLLQIIILKNKHSFDFLIFTFDIAILNRIILLFTVGVIFVCLASLQCS